MKSIYIFLDIDGVLNNTNKWEKDYKKWGYTNGTYSMDEKNIQNLVKLHRQLKDKYDLHYILSSTWRLSKDGSKIALARLRENGIKIDGITDPNSSADRGALIRKYLRNLKDGFDLAFAFDDDSFDIINYVSNNFYLINTSTKKGLTKKEIRYLKKILRKAEKRWKIKQKRF